MSREEKYWKSLVFVFFLGWLLMYANRTSLTAIMSALEGLWGLSRTQLGLINSVFFFFYAAAQVPAGMLADRWGRKQVLVPGFLFHALGALASGMATTFYWLVGARALTGLSQGTYFAPQYAISTAAVPSRYRALASALTMSGSALGIGLGTLIASFMVWRLGLNWRYPLLLGGGLAFILTTVMAKLVKPDARSEKADELLEPPAPFYPSANLVKLFLVGALSMYGFYVIVTWLPYYLQTVRNMEGGISGVVSTIMPLATIPSAILIGILADRSGERRRIMLWLLPLEALALALVVLSPSVIGLYAALLLYGLSGKLVIDPLLIASVAEQTAANSHGKAFALLNFAGTISMVLAPTITGLIVDLTGSFDSGFLLAALLQAMAWALLLSINEKLPSRIPNDVKGEANVD